MKTLFVSAAFIILGAFGQQALAQVEERGVEGFVGNSVRVFDESMKPSGQFKAADLSSVRSATRNGSTPFYRIQVANKTYLVLGSKIKFRDKPRTDMIPCNTRQGDFEAATHNSTMGSGEQKSCSEFR